MPIAAKLPAVLQQPNGNSLSVERILRQAVALIEQLPITDNAAKEDSILVCIEDLTILINNITR